MNGNLSVETQNEQDGYFSLSITLLLKQRWANYGDTAEHMKIHVKFSVSTECK